MNQNNQNTQNDLEYEIDIKSLINSLIERIILIVGLTGFITIFAILYALNIESSYKVTSSFTLPSDSSMMNINKVTSLSYTMPSDNLVKKPSDSLMMKNSKQSLMVYKKEVFDQFLTNLKSTDVQHKTFIDGNFIIKYDLDPIPIDDEKSYLDGFINSLEISKIIDSDTHVLSYIVSMEGSDVNFVTEYLTALIDQANSKNIMEISKVSKNNISERLDQLLLLKAMFLNKAKQDRLNLIDQIIEEDNKNIRDIIDQISRIQLAENQKKENEIILLTEAAKLAKSLGIIENNFKMLSNNASDADVTIALGSGKNLPEWYYYGEKALLQRIQLLNSRASQNPFIPELITLNNKLKKIQNNNRLKTLELRQDDSPFIPELVNLNLEIDKLNFSKKIDITDSNTFQIIEDGMVINTSPSKRRIVLLAFFASLILSSVLALVIGVLKTDEKAPS